MISGSSLSLEIQKAFPGQTLQGQSLRVFPLGFLLSKEHNSTERLLIYQRQLSRRLRLACGLDRLGLYPPRQLILNWPAHIEPLAAARILNDNLICWTEVNAYKFPLSEAALQRMKTASQGRSSLLETPLKKFIYPNQHQEVGDYIYRFGPVGSLLPLDLASRSLLDEFMCEFLSWTLANAKPSQAHQGLGLGVEHGDLHINNVLVQKKGSMGIIDFDHTRTNGLPLIDLISFVVHYAGFYIYQNYPHALNLALSRPNELIQNFKKEGFPKISKLWDHYYQPESKRYFILNRKTWINENSPEAKFFSQVDGVLEQYSEQAG